MTQNLKSPIRGKIANTKVTGTPSLPKVSGKDAARQPKDEAPQLPHERDETASTETVAGPDPKMVQAHKDLKRGLVDTGRRSAYGLSDGSPTPKADSPTPEEPEK